MVGAEAPEKLILGKHIAGRVACEEHCGGPNAEDAISHQHVTVVAKVPIMVSSFGEIRTSCPLCPPDNSSPRIHPLKEGFAQGASARLVYRKISVVLAITCQTVPHILKYKKLT
ncbi:hypothetical protein IEQ34_018779 [Dendrobium chrysotoxum]|uniref:Uncharacterized protein n=1 Tax=Dendrobium chrysotoxum TaxID=161865 RepID=A0AAV7G5Q0_DENCH|nr:hypothetical protein IEQ34_018779 [Dendrobium chrysotoxum]